MKIGMSLSNTSSAVETAASLRDFETAGLDVVTVRESYGLDAVSLLGYLAAHTKTVRLASGILNLYSRTPALLAMTAAGIDSVSEGRFTLGIGASGPQVIEGFHGVRYDAPLGRTREIVQICREVWARLPLEHDGPNFHIPLPPTDGRGRAGKPLKLMSPVLRPRMPIVLAALGSRNVQLAAEICEGWQPMFFLPEAAAATFGESIAAGVRLRSADLGALEVIADTKLLVSEDDDEIEQALADARAHLALYVGGMGSARRNFYNDLVVRFGFEAEAAKIQELYLEGDKAEAADAVPKDLALGVSLIGPRSFVAERVAAFAEAGVTTINTSSLAPSHHRQLAEVEWLANL